jgi:hypothetical protein
MAVREIGDYDIRRRALLVKKEILSRREDEVSRRAFARLNILDTFGPIAFDALLVAASGSELVNLAAHLGDYDLDTKKVRILGLSSWAAKGTGREPSLVGSWFAAPPSELLEEFDQNFTSTFESAPHELGRTAYDLVALAAILGAQEGGFNFDRKTLTASSGFAGIGGLFRFTTQGISERSLEVHELTQGGSRTVDTAVTRFRDPAN